MDIERFLRQIDASEARFQANEESRNNKGEALSQLAADPAAPVDVSRIDSPERIFRRVMAIRSETALPDEAAVPVEADDDRQMQQLLFERIISRNDLMNSAFLSEGARAALSVGRVLIRNSRGRVEGYGTGFLISPRLLMTNNHVLESVNAARHSQIQFNYTKTASGEDNTPVAFALDPATFFVTSERLDYSIVAVAATGSDGSQLADRGWSPLISESGKALVGEPVNIIQHPGGERQQLALRQNRITDVPGDFLHYTTDTKRGSSGSPVYNDQWQVAALHHAGVPKRDGRGRILLRSGRLWNRNPRQTSNIAWVANEGARISQIVADVRRRRLPAAQQNLFDGAFVPPPTTESVGRNNPPPSDSAFDCGDDGTATWTIPLRVSVDLGCTGAGRPSATPTVTGGQNPVDSPAAPSPDADDSELNDALAALRRAEDLPYYDEDSDLQANVDYYTDIPDALQGDGLFTALHELLKGTHEHVLRYRTARLQHLYPLIDLHPDGRLRSIYSGQPFDAEELIRRDFEVARERAEQMNELMASEAAQDPELLVEMLDRLESSLPFNCEHVVPQSWFAKRQPMKADLHHLFACESGCNSFRSNIPYYQFPPEDERTRLRCGRRETDDRQFEPAAGKGTVARATMYFLLRYPGEIGDEARELQRERLEILLDWNDAEPPDAYELHRNAEIQRVQGNRNPLIDYPDWARFMNLENGFNRP